MLPSGSLRVRVYAGIDPVSGQRHYNATTNEPMLASAENELAAPLNEETQCLSDLT